MSFLSSELQLVERRQLMDYRLVRLLFLYDVGGTRQDWKLSPEQKGRRFDPSASTRKYGTSVILELPF